MLQSVQNRLRTALESASPGLFSVYAIGAAFSAYFCMYAFRKPIGAATFEDQSVWGLELKIALLIGQLLGYACSKFLSIKFISELDRRRRGRVLLSMIGVAEGALILVALLPPQGKVIAMFFNGLPLGAVWGLVFSFLEGRRTSEILGAGLSMSYIVASGAVKTVGRWVLGFGVPEVWMPATVGLLFIGPFALMVGLLRCLPPPDEADRLARTERAPMDGSTRAAFYGRYALGLTALTVLYVALTAYRDFRDNFAFELWSALGYSKEPEVLTYAELPVAVCVMLALGFIYAVRDNRRAFFVVHGFMLAGSALVGGSTWLFQVGLLSGAPWMILVGSGLYLAYVPFGCVLFDRLIAMTRNVGTAVFMIYVTDAFGYAGSVGLMLYKNFGSQGLDWLPFFVQLSFATALIGVVGFGISWAYFAQRVPVRAPDAA